MELLICIPTIDGRQESLSRTISSYQQNTPHIDFEFSIMENSPTAGEGWAGALECALDKYGEEPDYVHFTNDDITCQSEFWFEACVEATEQNMLPCPVVFKPGLDEIESMGGQLGNPENLMSEPKEDWSEVGFTTVPFMSWHQWLAIGMIPVHYCSDVWVSERGRQLGMKTVIRQQYRLVHYQHQVGRGAGYPQHVRDAMDRETMKDYLSAAS